MTNGSRHAGQSRGSSNMDGEGEEETVTKGRKATTKGLSEIGSRSIQKQLNISILKL